MVVFIIADNIRALIGCLKDEQLANFCRILAVAISDLDIYDNKSSCKYCQDRLLHFCVYLVSELYDATALNSTDN